MCDFCDGSNSEEYFKKHGIAITDLNTMYEHMYLRFSNSGEEYSEGVFEIKFCPRCGRHFAEAFTDELKNYYGYTFV